jgi:D-amino-acid oxidase
VPNDCDVLVVGAGVSGLTTAICIAEAGLRAVIQAATPPGHTTSSVAGAIWGPHLVEDSPRAMQWRRDTLSVLRELAAEPGTGVRVVAGVQADRGAPPPLEPPPAWLTELGPVTPCVRSSLPDGFTSGWRYAAPLAHMPTYLGYLRARFEKAGGRVETATVTSLTAAARDRGARAVVNCTGMGARDLVPDPEVTPFRGQVIVAANPGISEFFIGPADDTADLVYLFPHGDTVVLGGTVLAGEESMEPVPALADRILRDCAAVEPRLRGVQIFSHRVGLRPYRPRIRLEAEPAAGGDRHPDSQSPLLVHNYGHGGAGITMSWGCAREAAALVDARLRSPGRPPAPGQAAPGRR